MNTIDDYIEFRAAEWYNQFAIFNGGAYVTALPTCGNVLSTILIAVKSNTWSFT